MIDLTKPVVYSIWRIPEAAWVEFFGDEFPSKDTCLNAGFRPLPRIDGHVYAVCLVIDRTPDKRRWEELGLLELLEQGAEVISGGGRPDDMWKLPEEHEPNVLRALVRQPEEERVRPTPGEGPIAGETIPENIPRKPRSVPSSMVAEGDVVEETGVRPVTLFTGKAGRPTPQMDRIREIQRGGRTR